MEHKDNKTFVRTSIIVALIGLLGTIIAASPNLYETFGGKAQPIPKSFATYDDIYGWFSISYPSRLGVQETRTDYYREVSMTSGTEVGTVFSDILFRRIISVDVTFAVSNELQGQQLLINSVEETMNLANTAGNYTLISNEKTSRGYLLHYEGSVELFDGITQNLQMYYLIEVDGNLFSSVMIGIVGSGTSQQKNVEYILSSFKWYPEKIRETIN